MAPSSSFDWYYQTLENIRFFSREGAEICIVTAKEPLGKYKAIVLRGEGKHREVLLSEVGTSMPEALQLLHNKSAEAVQNHISTYGFDYVREFKKRPGNKKKNADDDDDDSSVLSDGSASSTIALSDIVSNDSLSDDDGDDDDKLSIASTQDNKKGKSTTRKSRKANKGSRRIRQRSRSRSCSPIRIIDYTEPRRRPGSNNSNSVNGHVRFIPPAYARPGAGPNISGPPGPPTLPGWAAGPPPPPPPPSMRFPAPPMPPMHQPKPTPPSTTPQRDVRLHITWQGHGNVRVLETSAPSRRALTDAALAYLRSHTGSFTNLTPLDTSPGRLWSLKATLKQGLFGSNTYDMSNYVNEDLTRLFEFAGDKDIPLFEINVCQARPTGPPGPPSGMGRAPMA